MTSLEKKKVGAKFALLFVALAWGSSLVVVKSSTDSIMPNRLLAIRFILATVVLSLIFWKKVIRITKEDLKSGAIIGGVLFLAYCSETIGVYYAMPGKSAFISSAYCVIVPFLFWLVAKQRPKKENVIAAILCTIGITLASLTSSGLSLGDGLALLSAFLYAAHIVAVAKCSKGKDPITLTIIQFAVAGICATLVSIVFEGRSQVTYNTATVVGVLYLALICTAASLLLQNIAQKFADPSSASLLLSLESVFGVGISVIFLNEIVGVKLAVGFVFIFLAILVSELGLPKLKRMIKDKS